MTTFSWPVGLVFDLDDTLAPDTTTQLLRQLGVDPSAFWARVVDRVHHGWDHIPAYMWELQSSTGVTRRKMIEAGARATLHPGVRELFGLLRGLPATASGITLEYYLVSSGLRPLVESLPIAAEFTQIWASDFAYGPDDRPRYIKNIVGFTDKTRVLVEISKGFGNAEGESDPFSVNRRVADFRIPFGKMVFVGDGLTDVPAFALLSRHGGKTIAAHDASPDSVMRAEAFLGDLRVQAIAVADFTAGSPMFAALAEALSLIAGSGPRGDAKPGSTPTP